MGLVRGPGEAAVTSVERALRRAGQYRLMALGFAYPDFAVQAEFRRVLELHLADSRLGPELEALAACGAQDLVPEYTRLFDRTVTVSPYESDNVGTMRAFTKARDLSDVQGFYRAFGLAVGQHAAEMADHIQVELEFLGVLFLKEAYFDGAGVDDGLAVTRDARQAFFRDHVSRWVPGFCDRLEKATGEPFYRALAGATRALVVADLSELGLEAAPAMHGETRGDDSFSCPR